jgi:hypothetical protein
MTETPNTKFLLGELRKRTLQLLQANAEIFIWKQFFEQSLHLHPPSFRSHVEDLYIAEVKRQRDRATATYDGRTSP